jgi:hypothetical protein
MNLDFTKIKYALQRQFKKMRDRVLLQVKVEGDLLWQVYLQSFPAGTNPEFRKKTDHDCSSCRHFIRTIGGIVSVDENNNLISLWDVQVGDPSYQVVVDAMANLVKEHPIDNLFFHTERSVGQDKSFAQIEGRVATWDHFFLNLPDHVVVSKADLGPKLSQSRSTYEVLIRSLREIDLDSINTVLDLIHQGSLYRGQEHFREVADFRLAKIKFDSLASKEQRAAFCWQQSTYLSSPAARIRNTAIGTLLVDLAEGKDLNDAVASFEAKVAPANYKRPTSLVTKVQIEKARETLAELGLTSALERRYATLEDISIENLIFANREVRRKLDADVFDEIVPRAQSMKKLDKVEEIPIETFISDVIPKAEAIDVMVENGHNNHFVSLIAPCDPASRPLFKWPNNFSWSYQGNFADSIKERVKRAGGNVGGDLRCSLSWFNYDDLDLHMREPNFHIFFVNRVSPFGGHLDVDMNAGTGTTREAVENICYPQRDRMVEGLYFLSVNNYCRRETVDVGFEVEIEFDGQIHNFVYPKAVASSETIDVATIQYRRGVFTIIDSLPSSQASKEIWGIKTHQFTPVQAIMLSPNYWSGNGVGNKHYFFMLQGCTNPETARGFYNEFLLSDLNQHRKVLAIVGSRMKTQESERQLSGLGFSSTQRDHLICMVKGSFSRTVKVVF